MSRILILFTTLALVIGGGSLKAAERLHPHPSHRRPDRQEALPRHARDQRCHAGEILAAAEPLLNKYRDPAQGGLILMAACIESQLSIETQDGGFQQPLSRCRRGHGEEEGKR